MMPALVLARPQIRLPKASCVKPTKAADTADASAAATAAAHASSSGGSDTAESAGTMSIALAILAGITSALG
jgi:hypothetical protein